MNNTGKTINNWVFQTIIVSLLITFTQIQASADIQPIEAYPSAQKIWIGTEDGKILPSNEKHYRASIGGYITILKPNLSKLKKDEHWATIEAEQLDLDTRSLKLSRQKIHNGIQQLQEEQDELVEATTIKIEELQINKLELIQALEEPQLSKKLTSRIIEASKKIDTRIKNLNKKIDPAKLKEDLLHEKEELELELERKEKEHIRKKRKSIIRAPFDCILEITKKENFSHAEQGKSIWLEPSELYATLSDRSSYNIHFSNRNPILGSRNLSNLTAMIEIGTKKRLIKADYLESQKVDFGNSIQTDHIFKIQERSTELAKLSVNENRVALIFKKLPSSCHLIQKKNIALLAPEILEEKGWHGLIKHLWPNARVVEIGPQNIAVQPTDAN